MTLRQHPGQLAAALLKMRFRYSTFSSLVCLSPGTGARNTWTLLFSDHRKDVVPEQRPGDADRVGPDMRQISMCKHRRQRVFEPSVLMK